MHNLCNQNFSDFLVVLNLKPYIVTSKYRTENNVVYSDAKANPTNVESDNNQIQIEYLHTINFLKCKVHNIMFQEMSDIKNINFLIHEKS